ncbi:hypothetical protein EB796_006981 [Bugula neritina]|uniref:Uncharacterized protein n=1 Tax=Bugula neritina TaxID=10212 RepID=A0A7J7K7V3_BUGNE|nr:hypothetical protein EB796_006981 [Bugula neritina]
MTLSSDDMIQVEAALTLASVALGNQSVMREIWQAGQHLQFNYTRILAHLYSDNQAVRLLAGSALAAFAYNNMTEQQLIAAEGGVRFSCFLDFLQSEEEYFRCNAAFQIVNGPYHPRRGTSHASAAGIKIIVDILNTSQSLAIQALAADCIARLAHTRAGVPEAIVAIGCVERLCALMYSEQAQVRGSAAIALAYLSFNHTAERQLLNKCRCDPYLIKCLNYYTAKIRYLENSRKNGDTIKELVVCHAYPSVVVKVSLRANILSAIDRTGRPNLVSRDYRELALAAKSRHKGASSKPPDTASVRKSDSSQEFNGNSQSRASKVSTPAGNSEDVLLVAGGEVAMLYTKHVGHCS